MKKTFIIDTNVLIQDPDAIFNFEDNDIIIPLPVLEELDKHKMDEGEPGVHTRLAIRNLEKIRESGDILKGVKLPGGGLLRVEKNFVKEELPEDLLEYKSDNRILKICKGIKGRSGKKRVILVTKDIMLRVKASVIGIEAEDYTTEQAPGADEQYKGRIDVFVPDALLNAFPDKSIPVSKAYVCDADGNRKSPKFYENEFVVMRSDLSVKKSMIGRVEGKEIVRLIFESETPYGVTPRNVGQRFLQEALMQPAEKAPLVIVKGPAGCAKTFYSLAVGLEKTFNMPEHEREYRRILLCRPNSQFDDEIGFLPGTEFDKVAPLARPAMDNLEVLIDRNEKERYKNENELSDKVEELFDRDIIRAEAMNYLRGRSIVKTLIIIDEAQNATPSQVKGIITRAGVGSKVVLMGDPDQIDKPFLDQRTNGLVFASEKMKGSPLCWQITLTPEESTRSALAKDAIKRL